ncbi:MAG: hypothetical protein NW203_11885 [Hyphomonadaceae bacterium]|nr:hypothetical protein [Hyphomonadaceae bacterium]
MSDHGGHGLVGALGPYAMSREASGTSWQPDASAHDGVHGEVAGWMVMGHALLNGVYTDQSGPRGGEKAFLAGMVMGAARRDLRPGTTLNLRAMASPDPFMGKRGYPLLLAAGETADGVTELVDRQHPHELLMELSASLAQRVNDRGSVFVYAGLPGEPAFGPPVFMHRQSAMDSPEAPISHHWFDSTHITFGVLTAGYVQGDWKIEASRFRGREPDQDRFDIETGELDSTAVRVSWNPAPEWALQASWADLTSPEQLHPKEDETRWSVSALRTVRFDGGWWATTFAFAQKEHGDDPAADAWLLESAVSFNDRWTIFGRAERVENGELEESLSDVPTVGRLSLGAIRDWRVAEHVKIGIGANLTQNFIGDELDAVYGGDPLGATAFVRLKIG